MTCTCGAPIAEIGDIIPYEHAEDCELISYTSEHRNNKWYVFFSTDLIGGPYRKQEAKKIANFMNCGMHINQAEEQVIPI
jgi:hypothetical protein